MGFNVASIRVESNGISSRKELNRQPYCDLVVKLKPKGDQVNWRTRVSSMIITIIREREKCFKGKGASLKTSRIVGLLARLERCASWLATRARDNARCFPCNWSSTCPIDFLPFFYFVPFPSGRRPFFYFFVPDVPTNLERIKPLIFSSRLFIQVL